jgi:hypothetical protein
LPVKDTGSPVELVFVPGSTNDREALRSMPLNLPDNSVMIGDNLIGEKGFWTFPSVIYREKSEKTCPACPGG